MYLALKYNIECLKKIWVLLKTKFTTIESQTILNTTTIFTRFVVRK